VNELHRFSSVQEEIRFIGPGRAHPCQDVSPIPGVVGNQNGLAGRISTPDPGRGAAGPILLPPEYPGYGKRRNAQVNGIHPGAGFPDPGGMVPGRR